MLSSREIQARRSDFSAPVNPREGGELRGLRADHLHHLEHRVEAAAAITGQTPCADGGSVFA
jgi:hypothetical protein